MSDRYIQKLIVTLSTSKRIKSKKMLLFSKILSFSVHVGNFKILEIIPLWDTVYMAHVIKPVPWHTSFPPHRATATGGGLPFPRINTYNRERLRSNSVFYLGYLLILGRLKTKPVDRGAPRCVRRGFIVGACMPIYGLYY